MPEYLVVGRVLRPWGNKGELKVQAITEFPQRFSPGNRLYLQGKPFTIERSRTQAKSWILKLESIEDRESAQALGGQELEVPLEERFPLPPGQYYWFQVVGLQVVTSQGQPLGQVVEVVPNPANDAYLVRGEEGEFLVPAVEDVVKAIDLEAGRMVIDLPGLL